MRDRIEIEEEAEARSVENPMERMRAQAAAFLDLWERHMSELARLGPDDAQEDGPGDSAGTKAP